MLFVVLLLLGGCASEPLLFTAVFSNVTRLESFRGRRQVVSVSNDTTAQPTLTFTFHALSQDQRYITEKAFMTLAADVRLLTYGISSYSVTSPSTPAATPAPAAPPIGPGVVPGLTLVLRSLFHYTDGDGNILPDPVSKPNVDRLYLALGTALLDTQDPAIIRSRISVAPLTLVGNRLVAVVAFNESDYARVAGIIQQQRSIGAAMCASMEGCFAIILSAPTIVSFGTIETEGQAEYTKEKLNFLTGLILFLIAIVVAIVLGHRYSTRENEWRKINEAQVKHSNEPNELM